jgi:hypothetical protein
LPFFTFFSQIKTAVFFYSIKFFGVFLSETVRSIFI